MDALGPRCSYRCSDPSTTGQRYCGLGPAYEVANSTDCSKCVELAPPGPCVVQGYYYMPHSYTRFPKDSEANWRACQTRCKTDPFCTYFGFWPDSGCLPQGEYARLVNAGAACPTDLGNDACDGRMVISGPQDCGPDFYSMYPETATAEAAPVPNDATPEGCTTRGAYWSPNLENSKTGQAAWTSCQGACSADPACEHFAFWPDGGCVLQGANATLLNATLQCQEAASGAASLEACQGGAVISGPKVCNEAEENSEPAPPGNCTVTGYYYSPVGKMELQAATMESCQDLCFSDIGCQMFSFWPDQGCVYHNFTAKLVKAECSATEPDCPGSRVISGAQRCGPKFYSMYPVLAGTAPAPLPAPPGPFEPKETAAETAPSSSFPWGWLFLGALFVGAVVAAVIYGMGACDEDGKKKSKKNKKDKKARKEPETAALIQDQPLATTTAQVPMYQPVGAPATSPSRQAVSAFDALDRNHDGVLTRDEFAQARIQQVQQVQVAYPSQGARQLYIGSGVP